MRSPARSARAAWARFTADATRDCIATSLLKVLLPAVADDPPIDWHTFAREARVLATPNHRNIAEVYGFEESDGVRALIMALVEGPTLADRLAHGQIRIDEVLQIARQIAEAFEAAHGQRIIHRD